MNEVAKRDLHPLVEFKQTIDGLKANGEMDMLPSNVSFDAFKNAAVVAATDNPKILLADRPSLFKAIRRLAAAGLVPDNREAALVPFSTRVDGKSVQIVQAMPMVFGLIKMARNSGAVSDVRAHIVYQKEVDEGRFSYVAGGEEKLKHEPILFGDKGPAVGAYAVADMAEGKPILAFMDAAEIDKVRRSGASQLEFPQGGGRPTASQTPKGIWADWWEEMWKKTVIRRLIKRLPLSAEDVTRMMIDEDAHGLKDVTPAQEPAEPRKNLAARLQERAQEAAQPITGEIMNDGHWTDSIDLSAGFPGSDAFTEGAKAAEDTAKSLRDCPYGEGSQEAMDWCGGFAGKRGTME